MAAASQFSSIEPSVRRFQLLACLGAVVIGVVVAFWQRPALIQPPIEKDRSELTLINGRLHLKGDANLFTGIMVEHYGGGSLKSRSAVVMGQLDGVSEGWHTNGVMQVREFFVKGVSHGVRIKWYVSGAKLSETSIVRGRLEGAYRHWLEDGNLAEEVEMKEGHPEGVSRSYYASGFVQTEVELRQGQIVKRTTWGDGEHPGATKLN